MEHARYILSLVNFRFNLSGREISSPKESNFRFVELLVSQTANQVGVGGVTWFSFVESYCKELGRADGGVLIHYIDGYAKTKAFIGEALKITRTKQRWLRKFYVFLDCPLFSIINYRLSLVSLEISFLWKTRGIHMNFKSEELTRETFCLWVTYVFNFHKMLFFVS